MKRKHENSRLRETRSITTRGARQTDEERELCVAAFALRCVALTVVKLTTITGASYAS